MKKSFDIAVKSEDFIILMGNAYFLMLGIPRATGTVETVREPGDGFSFFCNETKQREVVSDGDGELGFCYEYR